MANIVTVTKTDQTKTGKTRVYFDGKNNWQDAVYLGSRCETPAVGARIEADTASKTFPDGKTIWFLNRFKIVPNQLGSSAAPVEASPAEPSGWDIPTGDLSRFVSNVIGSAIAAGLIKEPPDMAPWIASAYRALEAVRTGEILDFDDEPPKLAEVPDPAESQEFDDEEIPF